MATEDSFDIFGSDPFGRDYLYGLSTGRDRLGLAPVRYLEQGQDISQGTVKRKGYFGEIPTQDGSTMTEFSSAFEVNGRTVPYPLIVPTLTVDELRSVRDQNITPEIQKKAQQFALDRLSRGLDPFATPQELRYPQPENLNDESLNKKQNGLFSYNKTPEQQSLGSTTNNFVDYLLQKFNPQIFPTAGKTFIETVQGSKERITEKNFTTEELTALKNLIESTNNRGNVQYEDYFNLMQKEFKEKGTIPASFSPSILSILDPIGNVETTLGRFKYSRDANGNLIVVDSYDFNPIPTMSGAYGALRNYGTAKIPKGSGREVIINLGNTDPFANTIGSSIR